jgi:hypothetical protein
VLCAAFAGVNPLYISLQCVNEPLILP